jgi:hypothetical protein
MNVIVAQQGARDSIKEFEQGKETTQRDGIQFRFPVS